MSFDFDHAHKRRQEIAKSISGSFNTNNLEKSETHQDQPIGTPFDNQSRIAMNISQSYSNAPEISKAEEDELEKGGKKAFIGETRIHGGREYIRTASGWKFHGKGTGKKAAEHKASAASHTKDAKITPEERAESTEKKSSKKEAHPEGTVREFGGRNYIKKDGKWKYHSGKHISDISTTEGKALTAQQKMRQLSAEIEVFDKKIDDDKELDILAEMVNRKPVVTVKIAGVNRTALSMIKETISHKPILPKDSIYEYTGNVIDHISGDKMTLDEFYNFKKENKHFTDIKKEGLKALAMVSFELKRKEEVKPTSGKHIGDMSATEKKTLADKLGVNVKGKTTKQVDKELFDAMIDKHLADWKASKEAEKPKESKEISKTEKSDPIPKIDSVSKAVPQHLPKGEWEIRHSFKATPGGGWSMSFGRGYRLRSDGSGKIETQAPGESEWKVRKPPISGVTGFAFQYGDNFDKRKMWNVFAENLK